MSKGPVFSRERPGSAIFWPSSEIPAMRHCQLAPVAALCYLPSLYTRFEAIYPFIYLAPRTGKELWRYLTGGVSAAGPAGRGTPQT